jgi:hypothetical protein
MVYFEHHTVWRNVYIARLQKINKAKCSKNINQQTQLLGQKKNAEIPKN